MKKIFLILLFYPFLTGATYCINTSTGNDSDTGVSIGANCADDTNAWQSMSKAESVSYSAGDKILLKKGQTFSLTSQFDVPSSGSIGNLSNIAGWNTSTNWTNEGGNVWSMTFNTMPWRLTLNGTEYEPAFEVFDGDLYNCASIVCGIDATNRWVWRPTIADLTEYKLYVYATSNPATFYSSMQYYDTSNHITFGAYGTGAKPIVECINVVPGSTTPANWTAHATLANVWEFSLANNPLRLRLNGTEKPSARKLTDGTYPIGATYPWYWSNPLDILYVYSSGGNPGTLGTVIEGGQDCSSVFSAGNKNYLTIQDIEFQGGGSNVISLRGGHDIIEDNITAGYGGYGTLIQGGSASSYNPNYNFIIRNSSFNHQQNWSDSIGYDDMSGVREGLSIRDSMEKMWVYNNHYEQWDHGGINLEAHDDPTNFPLGVNRVWIFGNEIDSDDNYDGRAYSTTGASNKLYNVEIFFNNMHNMKSSSKTDAGPNIHVHNNIIHDNTIPGYFSGGVDQTSFVQFICTNSAWDSENNLVENNLMYNNEGPCVIMDQQSSDSCIKNGHIIKNNIAMNCGTDTIVTSSQDKAFLVETGSNVGANTWKNNLVFTDGENSTFQSIRYNNADYTASDFNAQSGSNGNVFSGNVYGDPLLDIAGGDYQLTASSSPAVDAGTDSSTLYDYYGGIVPTTGEDIGPDQFNGTVQTVYYVRADGGTSTQCTGLVNAAYDGSGTGEACAFSHPNWALAPQGTNPSKLASGNILEITDSSSYMMGYGSPNTSDTSKCHSTYTWDCYPRQIPAGTSAQNRTIIRSSGWNSGCTNPPQLWATERLDHILNINDHVEVNCLEMTDHEDCGFGGTSNDNCDRTGYPKGLHGDYAIIGKGTDVVFKNLNIHGMGTGGIAAGQINGLTVSNVTIRANGGGGWNFDGPAGTYGSNAGNLTFDELHVSYSGCQEAYPAIGTEADINDCCDQNQNPACYGDGLGTDQTGGNWTFTDSSFIANAEDGLDLLYTNATAAVSVKRVISMNNSGNQLKISSDSHVEDSKLIGRCTYLDDNNLTNASWGGDCRAGGDTVALAWKHAGQDMKFINNTITGEGSSLLLVVSNNGDVCDGTETITSRNSIWIGGNKWNGGDTALWIDQGPGNCALVDLDFGSTADNIVYNTSSNPCNDSGIICPWVDPLFDGITITLNGNWTCADDAVCDIGLSAASPGINAGQTISGSDTLDINGNIRTASWDIGAEEYLGASPTCGDDCTLCTSQVSCEASSATDCSGGNCCWYGGACHDDPLPEPDCDDDCSLCTTSSTCTASAAFDCNGTGKCCWDNGICGHTVASVCDIDHCSICNTSGTCSSAGCLWDGTACQILTPRRDILLLECTIKNSTL